MLHDIWSFLDSNFVSTLMTFIVGLVAWSTYYIRQRDNKRDAANIILLELQNAERQIKRISERIKDDVLKENVYVMQTESWNRYKYLFVRDFDRDEWDSISDYYQRCLLIDSSISHQSSLFQKNEEQLRINIQKDFADRMKEVVEEKDAEKKQSLLSIKREEAEEFLNQMIKNNDRTCYSPKKPINDVKQNLENWNMSILMTSIGVKLKRLARNKLDTL
ncbi:MAG: hypothetical protein HGA33_06245 [Candidatus Moranbacteria bacterium]|nr:hypothetical protein [Candidatus Moranbacteria bacterium]